MSIEAEQKIIGAILLHPEVLDDVLKIVTPEMFKSDLRGKMFFAETAAGSGTESAEMLPKVYQNTVSDVFSLADVQTEAKTCLSIVQAGAEAVPFAKQLRDENRAERLSDALNRVKGQPNSVDSDIDALRKSLEELTVTDESSMKTLSQITAENQDNYFKDFDKPKVMTGMKELDEILGGFDGGDLVLIGARPAVGKSAFAMQLTTHISNSLGLKVGYFNLEMQEKQIYERFVAAKSGLEITRIRRATRYLTGEKELFDEANKYLRTVDRILISTGSKRISDIKAECRGRDFDVIIIDYLQLVKSDGAYKGNRYAEVGAISHAAKALAMDLNIPVIALCQLNRAMNNRETKEPSMSDLRESGDFEQDASTILLLWNTDEEDKSRKCLKVEKQRQGKTGRVDLEFDGNRMKFTEIRKEPSEKRKDNQRISATAQKAQISTKQAKGIEQYQMDAFVEISKGETPFV